MLNVCPQRFHQLRQEAMQSALDGLAPQWRRGRALTTPAFLGRTTFYDQNDVPMAALPLD
jgi:hypothetical protein